MRQRIGRGPLDIHARIGEQHACRGLGRARHGRVIAHEVRSDRPVDQELKLGRDAVGVGGAELLQQGPKPQPAALLEGEGDLARGVVLAAQFGNCIDERTAAEIGAAGVARQPIEAAENLLDRRLVGRRDRR